MLAGPGHHRRRVPRRHRRDGATFACVSCRLLLTDGVLYAQCPACGTPVDWVDLQYPVYCCHGCDVVANDWLDSVGCERCDRPMVRLWWPPVPDLELPPARPPWRSLRSRIAGPTALKSIALALFSTLVAAAFVPGLCSALLGLLAPVVLVGLVVVALAVVAAPPILLALVALVWARETRVVHGLEHATIAVLTGRGAEVYDGQAQADAFTVRLVAASSAQVSAADVEDALREAAQRIRAGEVDLALSRRCGTSMVVGVLGAAVLVAAGAAVAFLSNATWLVGVGLVAAFAAFLFGGATQLGLLAQRWATVSTDFVAARPREVLRQATSSGTLIELCVRVELELADSGTKRAV